VAELKNLGALRPLAVEGDYTSIDSLQRVLNKRQRGGLTLAFIDPTDLSVPFETVQYLAANTGSLDLLVNVPIRHDFRRNAANAVLDDSFQKARVKYESFLGRPYFMSSSEVLDRLSTAADWPKELSLLFLEAYKEQLRTLGFCYFGTREIGHYYHLLFATRDKKGLEFWNKCQKIEFTGQRTLF
jgi:three-Cys-motif partner protein